jgi:hypothetical protein
MFKVYRAGKRYMVMTSYDHDRKKSVSTFTDVGDCTMVEEFESIDMAKASCNERLRNDPTLVFYIEGPDGIIEETIMNEEVRADIERKEARNLAWKIAPAVSAIVGIAYYLIAAYSQVTYSDAIVGWGVITIIFILLMLFYGARSIAEVSIMIVIIAILGGIACPKLRNMQLKKEAVRQTGKVSEINSYDRSR